MHQNPSSFGCLENSIFIFMAFFWKTVEVWEYSFRPFQNSCTNSSQPWQELISLFKQKIGISKDIFHKKQGTGSSPWKNSSTSKQRHSIPRARKGDQIELFLTFWGIFSHKYPWPSHNKAWSQKRNILWKPTKISAPCRRFEVSEHLQVIFGTWSISQTGTLKTKLLFLKTPQLPHAGEDPS